MAKNRQRAACVLLLAALCGSHFVDAVTFTETIDSSWQERWTHSSDAKYSGKFVAEAPPGLSDVALKVPEKAQHYGIATAIPESVDPAEGLVLQYDLKLAEGLTCGGAYLKFLTADANVKFEELKDDSSYTVMFGPDKCGSTNKVHLILRHKSPLDGAIEEKHLKFPPAVLTDTNTHVYTAILHANNTYDVLIDGESKKSGSLFEDFEPPFTPAAEIDDPEDSKPETWVDTARIPDPEAVKPEEWDEDAPAEIVDEDVKQPEGWLADEPDEVDDADAKQPEDWDEEEDGEWEPPRIANPLCKDAPGCGVWTAPSKPNPAYKGTWTAPLIDNPEYKGVWSPQKISNPKYYDDTTPLANIGKINAVAIEIWTMDSAIYFDNIVASNDPAAAAELRESTFAPKKVAEEAAAKVKAAEEAVEAEKEAEVAKEAASKVTFADRFSAAVDALFDRVPALEPIRETVQPALDYLLANEYALYAAVGAPTLLLLLSLLSLLFGGKKVVAKAKAEVAKAKKEDRTVTKDDAPVAEDTDKGGKDDDDADVANSAARKRAGRPRRDT